MLFSLLASGGSESAEQLKGGAESPQEVLALKHESRIHGQWSDPVSGSMKSQASSPWAKQHRDLTYYIMEKPHTGLDECPTILLLCFRARISALKNIDL